MAKQSLSIIIPNYNGVRTIDACLEALLASRDDAYEVVVVDDCSHDGSVGIVEKYPCKLIRLAERTGASAARNAGAFGSTGEILFFIDNDCIVTDTTIPRVRKIIAEQPTDVVVGQNLATFSELDRGGSIDLQGAFSRMDFDLKTGESPADYAILCAQKTVEDKAYEGVESGLVYDSALKKLTGTFNCK